MDETTLYASVPVPAAGAMIRKEAFGAMLAGGNMPILNLNQDAAAIWELVDGKRSVREIEAVLLDQYETDDVRQTLPEVIRFLTLSGIIILKGPL